MSTAQHDQAELRVRRLRARLLMQHPFYGSIGCELGLEVDATCDTAWTNGKAIGFNPDFVLGLSSEHLTGVIAHEILHVAMRHNYRRGQRDRQTWNVACDYAINSVLVKDGFKLPDDALLDERFEGLSAEQVYAALLDDAKDESQGNAQGDVEGEAGSQGDDDQGSDDQGNQGGDDSPTDDQGDDPSDGDQDEGQDESGQQGGDQGSTQDDQDGDEGQGQSSSVGEVRDAPEDAPAADDWKSKVVQAGKLAQNLAASCGLATGGAADRAVKDARKSTVSWRDLLQQFLTKTQRDDFDWSRPSRRHLSGDVYMPSMCSDGCDTIAIAIDTSGSIDERALQVFLGEVQGVVDQLNPERVVVYCADTAVRNREVFERGDLIKPQLRGGGGTCFDSVFEAIDNDVDQPACVLFFTDGMARMPKTAPTTPTLWAFTTPQDRHEHLAEVTTWCEMPTFGDRCYLDTE